ncbi:MAG: GNAT family N-acetyltransferase [Shimia sp.]
MMPATLTADRLVLRQFHLRDLPAYVAYYTGPRAAGVGGPKARHVVVDRFFAMAGQWPLRGFGRYAITLDPDAAAFGHVGVMAMDPEVAPEITWTLWDADREGRGYTTEAARAVLDAYLARADHVIAHIAADNAGSCAVAPRLGMVEEPDAPAPDWMPTARTFVARAAA